MKKLILLPVFMLAATSLNGMARLAQQALPALRQISRGAQLQRLPATIPSIRPAGMRLLSTSSRAQQDGYDYAGYTGEQHARFGNREAYLLGAAALAGTAYYFNNTEGRKLKQAQHIVCTQVYADESKIEENSEVAAILTNLQGEYPKVEKDYNGEWKILKIMAAYPDSRATLMQAIIENITALITANYRFEDVFSNTPILKILKLYPESRLPIIDAITSKDNFANIVLHYSSHGRIHIFEILDKYPDTMTTIVQTTADNLVTLTEANCYEAMGFMDKLILEKYPTEGSPIINALIKNLPRIIHSGNVEVFTKKIMAAYPESRDQIVNAVINNMPHEIVKASTDQGIKSIKSKIKLYNYENILVEVLEKYPESITPIIQFAMDRATNMEILYNDRIITKIIKNCPEERAQLIAAINKNAAKLSETRAGKKLLLFIQSNYPDLATSTSSSQVEE